MKRITAFILAAICWGLAAAGIFPSAPVLAKTKSLPPIVAVAPFDNETVEFSIAAESGIIQDGQEYASDKLIEQLLDSGEISLVETPEDGAEYLIKGKIKYINVITSKNQVVAIGGESYKVAAELQAELVRLRDGRRLAVYSGKGESAAHAFKLGLAKLDIVRVGAFEVAWESVESAINKAAAKMAKKIIEDAK